ncbi:MAG TPA: hypothetical protein VHC95_00770, partial [Opitutales bacterium]|nr:hypothetical protein [Opitutales bacterium]
SGRIYFSAIKGFSSDTQNFLNLVPSTLRVNYPLEATLTSAAGQELQASILGHDSASVQFSLPDGKIYTYAMAKLAPASQEFLQMLPAYHPDQAVSIRQLKVQNIDSELRPLADNLATLIKKDGELLIKLQIAKQTGAAIAAQRSGSRGSYTFNAGTTPAQFELDSNRDAIANACRQINPLLDPSPRQGDAKLAQAAWSRAMGLVRQIDQLRGTITSATDSESNMHRNELRAKQADLIAALNEVNRLAGAYAPVGAY